MSVLSLLLPILWGILIVGILCWRRTISVRTFAIYMTLGAGFGVFWTPLVLRLVNPYYEPGTVIIFAGNVAVQLLLLSPLLLYYFRFRLHRVTSIADAFLLAFAIGLGHDLAGAVLIASAGGPTNAVTYLPPAVFSGAVVTLSGYAYWTALVALVVAAMLRFRRSRAIAIVAGVACLLVVAAAGPVAAGSPENFLQKAVASLTLHGLLIPWLTLALVVWLSVMEGRWVAAHTGERIPEFAESRQLFGLIQYGKWAEYRALSSRLRWERRWAIRRAEASVAPSDSRLPTLAAQPEKDSAAAGAPVAIWKRPLVQEGLPWLVLAAVLFVPSLAPVVWNSVTTYTLPAVLDLTTLNLALILLIGYRYLTAGVAVKPGDTDDLLRFRAEGSILRVSLWALVLVCLAKDWTAYYPFPSVYATVTGTGLPAWSSSLATTFLLFMLAAVSVTGTRAGASRSQPVERRRRAFTIRLFTATFAFLMFATSTAGFTARLEGFHQQYGVRVFGLSQQLGTNGNKLAYFGFALENLVRVLPLGIVLVMIGWSIRNLFREKAPRMGRWEAMASLIVCGLFWGVKAAHAGTCASADQCICVPEGVHDGGGGAAGALVVHWSGESTDMGALTGDGEAAPPVTTTTTVDPDDDDDTPDDEEATLVTPPSDEPAPDPGPDAGLPLPKPKAGGPGGRVVVP